MILFGQRFKDLKTRSGSSDLVQSGPVQSDESDRWSNQDWPSPSSPVQYQVRPTGKSARLSHIQLDLDSHAQTPSRTTGVYPGS